MTNEDAVIILEEMWAEVEYYEEHEALDMAIEALSNNKKQTDSLIRTSADAVSEADVIYRQDAIDDVQRIGRLATLEDNDAVIRMSAVEYILFNLPSAQRTGEWLRYGEDGNPNEEDTVFWQCDQCLETYTGRTTRIPNYCPNCGADMRGGGV